MSAAPHPSHQPRQGTVCFGCLRGQEPLVRSGERQLRFVMAHLQRAAAIIDEGSAQGLGNCVALLQ